MSGSEKAPSEWWWGLERARRSRRREKKKWWVVVCSKIFDFEVNERNSDTEWNGDSVCMSYFDVVVLMTGRWYLGRLTGNEHIR